MIFYACVFSFFGTFFASFFSHFMVIFPFNQRIFSLAFHTFGSIYLLSSFNIFSAKPKPTFKPEPKSKPKSRYALLFHFFVHCKYHKFTNKGKCTLFFLLCIIRIFCLFLGDAHFPHFFPLFFISTSKLGGSLRP